MHVCCRKLREFQSLAYLLFLKLGAGHKGQRGVGVKSRSN